MHERLIKCGLVSGCCGCAASHPQALCHSWSIPVKPRDLPRLVNASSASASAWMKGTFCLLQGMRDGRGIWNSTSLSACTACSAAAVQNVASLQTGIQSWQCWMEVSWALPELGWPHLHVHLWGLDLLSTKLKEKFSVLSWKSEWTLDL